MIETTAANFGANSHPKLAYGSANNAAVSRFFCGGDNTTIRDDGGANRLLINAPRPLQQGCGGEGRIAAERVVVDLFSHAQLGIGFAQCNCAHPHRWPVILGGHDGESERHIVVSLLNLADQF